METVILITLFIVGVLIGGAAIRYLSVTEINAQKRVIESLQAGASDVIESAEAAFKNMATQALEQSAESFLRLAGTKLEGIVKMGAGELEATKRAISETIANANRMTESLTSQMVAIRRDLGNQGDTSEKLRATTEGLRNLLSSSQQRGRWGERIVEDIIRQVGMVKDISYVTQHVMKDGGRPDFTFKLSDGMMIHLDVKFPMDNYEAFLNAQTDYEREAKKKAFAIDVRGHLKTLAGKGYVNPGEGTVDYMIAFIPNESMYAFIHDSDPTLMDYGMEKHIMMASPLTLYAVLSLVRQSVRSFAMNQKTGAILAEVDKFVAEWNKNQDLVGKLGRSIETLSKDFTILTTTREKAMERRIAAVAQLGTGEEADGGASPVLELGTMGGGDNAMSLDHST